MIRINNTQYFNFLQQADALRRTGSLCDAIISVKSQTFRAHRLVLACASRRLAQQLALGDVDSPVHCTLEYFSPRTFQQVLDFTYTQTMEVSVDDLHLLLRAAQLLEMEPLEDQCRKQLDNFHYRAREENKSKEIKHVKEEKESAEQKYQKQKGSPVQEEKVRETSPLVDKTCNITVMENISPSDPSKNHNRPPSPRKKSRLSPASATPYNRDSVITRPPSSSSSFSSPWTLPTNVWNSVTLRRIAENYSNLVATHPLQTPNQSSVAYPFSFTTPHMFPILGSHFQSSVMGYSGFHPRYTQGLYAGSTDMGSIIKQGLLKRKKPSPRAFTGTIQTGEPSYHDVPKASTERVKGCQHCSASPVGDPALQPASTPSGEKPFECRLCGQRSRDYSAMIKHLRTHGGAAPYQCTVCLEYCSSLVAMQRHVKNHAMQDFPPDWSISSTYLYTSHI
ncbi:Zinc finger and BTB domain-containing protein 16-A [Collichthys lucidus]|uniref:Zinc finger and BTB domain-containing protein 16-A n=1 Tax=Collichthys lucidus TaxID=240159 RepID=A0A4U5V2I1_COLLU|nr:Zinc finger and BTB domain-containing protein 16-A [Collichthys lucidus]